MCAEKTDYDELIKDHLRIRLMETGWTDQVGLLVQNAIDRRAADGQVVDTIKFEQLYEDVRKKARDAISNEMETEFHEKIGIYLTIDLPKTDKDPTSPVPLPITSNCPSMSTISSSIPSSSGISYQGTTQSLSNILSPNSHSCNIPSSNILSSEISSSDIPSFDIPSSDIPSSDIPYSDIPADVIFKDNTGLS
jgi:hypothetical protein